MKCNSCGKEMTENGSCIIAVSLEFTHEKGTNFSREFCQKQAGVYELGKKYNICWECYLKSLNVIP